MRICLILVFSLVSACRSAGQTTDPCPRRLRAIFDVGSGTTKLNVSEVAVCADDVRLVRTLDDRSALSVSLEAAKDRDGVINEKGVADLVRAVTTLREVAFAAARRLAPAYSSIDFAAAGTHAFRSARNQARLTAALAELGIPIVPLTQAQEAAMGLAGAARATPDCQGRPLVAWDIGGGSQQFTAADGRFRGLGIGSEGFKARVISTFNLSGVARCEAKDASANPVGQANVDRALDAAQALAACDGPLCNLNGVCVIGVGGLHARSVHAQVMKWWPEIKACACPDGACEKDPGGYRRRDVECLARELADKNDCEPRVRGPYSGMADTNLILIAGFMRALNINYVRVVDVNMGHGLAVDRERLTFRTRAIP